LIWDDLRIPFVLACIYRGGLRRGRGGGSMLSIGEAGQIEGVVVEGGYFGSIDLFD